MRYVSSLCALCIQLGTAIVTCMVTIIIHLTLCAICCSHCSQSICIGREGMLRRCREAGTLDGYLGSDSYGTVYAGVCDGGVFA